jgi:WD40 repeat protein
LFSFFPSPFYTQDQKVRLYNWDGKSFQEVGILEANKGLVSALAFSPDGLKLAAGDVSTFLYLYSYLSTVWLNFFLQKKKTLFPLVNFNSMCMLTLGRAEFFLRPKLAHSFLFLTKQTEKKKSPVGK